MLFFSYIVQLILNLYCSAGILFLSCVLISGHIYTSMGFVLKPPPRVLIDVIETNQNQLHSLPNSLVDGPEIAQVKFIIPLRYKRDLIERDFHIIHIHRTSTNSTTIIHLSRKNSLVSSDFKIVVKNGDEDSEMLSSEEVKSDCLYHGTIISEPGGSAALSACGGQLGFSGLIMNTDEHWMIEPHPVDMNTFHETLQVPHLIHLPQTLTPQIKQQCYSDALRVPPDELQKANNEFERLGRREENIETYNENNKKSMNQNLMLDMNRKDEKNSNQSLSDNNNINLKLNNSNKKRQTNIEIKKTIEIAVFTDTDFYNQMKIRYPKDTLNKIKNYVLTVINAMDLLYEQPSLGLSIAFRLVHLEIQKKWPLGLDKHEGQSKEYLSSFCDYSGNMNIGNELWDHSLMLTGTDLHEGGSTGTAGLAWAGTMCYRYYSCSVSEAIQLGVVYVITHEIGHSMGIEHDGSGVSSKCDSEKYIMSPTTGPGKVSWSTCSSQNINDFINYGTSNVKEKIKKITPDCLSETAESKTIDYTSSSLPGQLYDASKQCILSQGKSFTPYMKKKTPYNNPCSMLYCGNVTHAVSTHPALEGTTCDTGKLCRAGQCVKK